MAHLLDGGKALVTGGGRGIGAVIARLLADEGASVVLSYRESQAGADKVAEEIRARGGTAWALKADLSYEYDAQQLVEGAAGLLGGLSIVVNNASGFGPLQKLAEASWEDLDREWQAVVKPTVLVTHFALPYLVKTNGRVVNLAATLVERPAVGYGAHTMAKSAVLAYTRTLAREVGPQGVTVNAVSPGMTLTDFSESLPEAQKEAVRALTPLRRLAAPDDVARAVVFFCSPLASFVTGANLAPDGGLAIL